MDIQQSNEYLPGTWKRLHLATGEFSASMTCPKCEKTSILIDHTIDAVGNVTPSVVCGHKDCDFHEYIVLVGWSDGS